MAILQTTALTKSFGGLTAVRDVSIAVAEREVHAIIGPNGAGKSTMVNLLTGQIPPTSGKVTFEGRDITGLRPDRISKIGIGRSFQRTNVFPTFTCLENCWLAAQSRMRHSFRFFRRAERYASCGERAERALELCGLTHRRDTAAADMSYGEQRQLEIGMMLATEPRFLVLDEPMAGMGKEESGKVVALLRDLARSYPLVLVEHDMDAVFSIADTLTVMVNGTVIASGPLDEVRDSTAVQEAYLGDGEEDY
ncbi:ABC transporter ATP-binding protein [Caenispirillum bisanense]|uniref:Amino acid/amide ABC transporter ATP-binding protein 1, HAAT family n=1 Tax=Caenispirillum bisanense TaxID=414052 RepID=A0A286GLA3_9PROT|nr:ABC transporter ATP-binding protein [Caenispirillum bisanense]SOD96282.1 amino acid/amide ABC transporter ATP-binding protein 1, HAAT family [Caenispirillum bisanense]